MDQVKEIKNVMKWINYSNFDCYVAIMTETKACWWWTLPSYCCYCMNSFHVRSITKGATSLSKKNDYILFRNIFQPQQEWCLNGVRRLMLSVFSDTPLALLRHPKRNLVILGNYWKCKKMRNVLTTSKIIGTISLVHGTSCMSLIWIWHGI